MRKRRGGKKMSDFGEVPRNPLLSYTEKMVAALLTQDLYAELGARMRRQLRGSRNFMFDEHSWTHVHTMYFANCNPVVFQAEHDLVDDLIQQISRRNLADFDRGGKLIRFD